MQACLTQAKSEPLMVLKEKAHFGLYVCLAENGTTELLLHGLREFAENGP